MEHDQDKQKWYKALLTPQTFIYLMAGMVFIVVFWFKTEQSWIKQKEYDYFVDHFLQIFRFFI